MFDVDTALTGRLEEVENERSEWEKLQDESRKNLGAINLRVLHGINAVRLGEQENDVNRMAEGYALCGEYQKAYALSRNGDYLKAHNALTNPTDCDCVVVEQKFQIPASQTCGGGTARITKYFPVEEVPTAHGNVMLLRCVSCGHLRT